MSHQKVDSSFDPWLARVPRRPSESPVQSSGAHRTSVNTSARPGAEAGLTHSPVTSTAPLGTTPTSGTHWGRARGRPRLQQNEALSLLVGQAKGSPRSQYPPSSARHQITAGSTGAAGQIELRNVTHLEHIQRPAQSCLPPRHPQMPSHFPSPNSKSTFERWPQKQGRSQSRPPDPSSADKLPHQLDLHHHIT